MHQYNYSLATKNTKENSYIVRCEQSQIVHEHFKTYYYVFYLYTDVQRGLLLVERRDGGI